jgi:hypothetical protein
MINLNYRSMESDLMKSITLVLLILNYIDFNILEAHKNRRKSIEM